MSLSKRPRIGEFAFNESYVSQAGLANVLRMVKAEGLPNTTSRSSIYRERKSISHAETPYGKLMEERNLPGSDEAIAICNPLAALYFSHNQSSGSSILHKKIILFDRQVISQKAEVLF